MSEAPAPVWPLYVMIGWFALLGLAALMLLGLGMMFAGEPGGRGGMGLFDWLVLCGPLLVVVVLGSLSVMLFRRGLRGGAYGLCALTTLAMPAFLILFGL